jgi:CUB/sushi domain-containing protein
VVNCGEVAAPANGFRVGSEFTYKKVLAFDCDPGYKLVGNQIRECQENGLWSGSRPTCVGK